MEASWHLRFARTDKVVMLVTPAVVAQLRNALFIEPDWTLETEEEGEFVRAVFRRKRAGA